MNGLVWLGVFSTGLVAGVFIEYAAKILSRRSRARAFIGSTRCRNYDTGHCPAYKDPRCGSGYCTKHCRWECGGNCTDPKKCLNCDLAIWDHTYPSELKCLFEPTSYNPPSYQPKKYNNKN
jgi:hypothetical protein